jgi:flagellar hook protein FlgE
VNAQLAEDQSTAVTTGTYDPTTAANSMTAYDASASTPTGVKPDFTIQIPISDSLGGQHTLQVDFLNDSTSTNPNQWEVEVQTVPASDVPGNGTSVEGQVAYGTATFSSSGQLTGLNLTDSQTGNALTSSATGQADLNINWDPSLGLAAGTQQVSLDLSGLTQYSTASSVSSVDTNGTTFGSLSTVSVGSDGVVTATFNNGTSRAIAQIAMATFPNEDGLQSVNGDAYQATTASGAYNLTTAGEAGAGTIASSALEASTVDLSTEFTDLITTQSAYSAASKVITTADNMTQSLLQIIQG